MPTCFGYYDILAKTCGRMTTATTFPAKMTRVHARAVLSIEKNLVPVVALVLESIKIRSFSNDGNENGKKQKA